MYILSFIYHCAVIDVVQCRSSCCRCCFTVIGVVWFWIVRISLHYDSIAGLCFMWYIAEPHDLGIAVLWMVRYAIDPYGFRYCWAVLRVVQCRASCFRYRCAVIGALLFTSLWLQVLLCWASGSSLWGRRSVVRCATGVLAIWWVTEFHFALAHTVCSYLVFFFYQ